MPIDFEKMREKYRKAREEQASRGKTYRVPPGKTVVRLLPVAAGRDEVYKAVGMHFNLGEHSDQRAFCPTVCNADPCPICEVSQSFYKSEDEEDRIMAKALRVKKQWYWNVIVRGKEASGSRILHSGEKIYNGIMANFYDENDNPRDLTDVQRGHDIIIERSGKGLLTDYTVTLKVEPTVLGDKAQIRKWIEMQEDLNAFVKVRSYQELEKLLDETDLSETPESTNAEPEQSQIREPSERDEPDDDIPFKPAPPIRSAPAAPSVPSAPASDKPMCFASPADHDPTDVVCTSCVYFRLCANEVKVHPESYYARLAKKTGAPAASQPKAPPAAKEGSNETQRLTEEIKAKLKRKRAK